MYHSLRTRRPLYMYTHHGIRFHALQSFGARGVWFSHEKPAKSRSLYYWIYPESKQPSRRLGRAGHRFFLYPFTLSFSLSLFLSLCQISEGSVTQQKSGWQLMTDRRSEQAVVSDMGGGTSRGPSRSVFTHRSANTNLRVCVHTFTNCI